MTIDCTWTWDVLEPRKPEKPEPLADSATGNDFRTLPKLMAGIFDSFRDEPAIYARLAAIVKAWREGQPIIYAPPPGQGSS